MEAHGADREEWGSRTEFLFAAIGSAIGVGNILRFPVLVYRYGWINVLCVCEWVYGGGETAQGGVVELAELVRHEIRMEVVRGETHRNGSESERGLQWM